MEDLSERLSEWLIVSLPNTTEAEYLDAAISAVKCVLHGLEMRKQELNEEE